MDGLAVAQAELEREFKAHRITMLAVCLSPGHMMQYDVNHGLSWVA